MGWLSCAAELAVPAWQHVGFGVPVLDWLFQRDVHRCGCLLCYLLALALPVAASSGPVLFSFGSLLPRHVQIGAGSGRLLFMPGEHGLQPCQWVAHRLPVHQVSASVHSLRAVWCWRLCPHSAQQLGCSINLLQSACRGYNAAADGVACTACPVRTYTSSAVLSLAPVRRYSADGMW